MENCQITSASAERRGFGSGRPLSLSGLVFARLPSYLHEFNYCGVGIGAKARQDLLECGDRLLRTPETTEGESLANESPGDWLVQRSLGGVPLGASSSWYVGYGVV